jgi:hypothetical protein
MSGPHHIVVPAGKVIPHDPATFANSAEPVPPERTADPLAELIGQVNDVLHAAELGRPVGAAEKILALVPLADGVDRDAVLAALQASGDADLAQATAWPFDEEPPGGIGTATASGGTGIIAVAFGKVVPH